MGHAQPTTVITNKFIEDLGVGTTAAWIEEKIGILTRVTSLPLEYIVETKNSDPRKATAVASTSPYELGLKASQMALERAGIKGSEVGLLIVNCCTPKFIAPTEFQKIATALNVTGSAYNVFTACPAFALHLDFINSFRRENLPKYVLCVSTATLTHHVNYNDRTDGAIWGDGAAAWVVSTQKNGRLNLVYSSFMSDPTRCDAVVVDTFKYFRQDGRAVRNFSVMQTVKLVKQLEDRFDINWERDIFIGHQANKTMLDQIINNREIPSSNHWYNVDRVGNQAGAGAPAVISENWDKIKSGSKIAVAVVGAGLSWGSALFEVV